MDIFEFLLQENVVDLPKIQKKYLDKKKKNVKKKLISDGFLLSDGTFIESWQGHKPDLLDAQLTWAEIDLFYLSGVIRLLYSDQNMSLEFNSGVAPTTEQMIILSRTFREAEAGGTADGVFIDLYPEKSVGGGNFHSYNLGFDLGVKKVINFIRSMREGPPKNASSYLAHEPEVKKTIEDKIQAIISRSTKNKDGSYSTEGGVHLSYLNLKELPVSFKKVGGNFLINGNQLTSLKGCPKEVGKMFDCSQNNLTSLEGGPQEVGENYIADGNKLISLRGAPKKVEILYVGSNPKSSEELKKTMTISYAYTISEKKVDN